MTLGMHRIPETRRTASGEILGWLFFYHLFRYYSGMAHLNVVCLAVVKS